MVADRRTLSYSLWSFGPIAVTLALAGLCFERTGFLIVALLGLPWLAWRYDNETGTFLPLVVLLLLVLAVLALVLFLTALVFFAGH